MSEVMSCFDFSQLQPNESPDQCGFAATALCFAAGPPGGAPRQPAQWAIEKMASWYTEYNGADIPSNHRGMELWQLYKLIVEKGGHYQAIDANAASIASWIEARYPVIIAVVESSVYDVHLKARPYSWDTTGLNHIFVVTGIDSGHIFLCRDTVNQHSGSPYSYDGDKLQYISATVFVPDWMPRPTSSIAPHEEENVTIDISMPLVAHYYEAIDDHQWKCKANGKIIHGGILDAYRKWSNKPFSGLTDLGLVLSNEQVLDDTKYPGVRLVFFERGRLLYDPHHLIDNPPGSGDVYAVNLQSWPGQDPELLAKIKDLQAQLTQAQAQLAQPQQAKQHYLDGLDKAIADLQAARGAV